MASSGRALRDQNVQIDQVYCSPSLRCVQTAVGIIKGMESRTLSINIEPGLYEWTRWCGSELPSWMEAEEFAKLGYPVNDCYSPVMRPADLWLTETLNDYYDRSFALIREILRNHDKGTVLLVAHGPSMDALTRQICGGAPRTVEELMSKLRQIPYLACLQIQEQCKSGDTDSLNNKNGGSSEVWKYAGSPIPSLTHSANPSFDPEFVLLLIAMEII
ncbi:unnamed protein product [Gongylonema pulchrum]|uniref:Protein UBASH3A homolog n=1 Tax=Gongylonema pulchrum TaxID=637853 RepID=A0A183EN42_9BILA|nr:unnamed protein product [Gongylonema pulchrum]